MMVLVSGIEIHVVDRPSYTQFKKRQMTSVEKLTQQQQRWWHLQIMMVLVQWMMMSGTERILTCPPEPIINTK